MGWLKVNDFESAYMQGLVNGVENERRSLVESLRYDRSNQSDPEVVELYDAIISKIENRNY
jgi:hypothetical protein